MRLAVRPGFSGVCEAQSAGVCSVRSRMCWTRWTDSVINPHSAPPFGEGGRSGRIGPGLPFLCWASPVPPSAAVSDRRVCFGWVLKAVDSSPYHCQCLGRPFSSGLFFSTSVNELNPPFLRSRSGSIEVSQDCCVVQCTRLWPELKLPRLAYKWKWSRVKKGEWLLSQ